jgi:hypothetical protein
MAEPVRDSGMRSLILLAAGLSVLPAVRVARADDGAVRVNVNVEMTAAGRRLVHPTRGNPTYYFPLPVGYKEEGGYNFTWERPPPPAPQVMRLLAKALAEQGYLPARKGTHPTLVLLFKWGYWAPNAFHGQDPNHDEMQMLVGANTVDTPVPLGPKKKDVVEASRRIRWYMTVTAIDFDDWLKHHSITSLWREHVSTEVWGHYLDEVLPTLITAGAPALGRDTPPQFIRESLIPMGHVEVGTPVLKTYAHESVPPPNLDPVR